MGNIDDKSKEIKRLVEENRKLRKQLNQKENFENLPIQENTTRKRADTIKPPTIKEQLNSEIRGYRGIVPFGQISKIYRSQHQQEILNLLLSDKFNFVRDAPEYYISDSGGIAVDSVYRLNEIFDIFIDELETQGLV